MKLVEVLGLIGLWGVLGITMEVTIYTRLIDSYDYVVLTPSRLYHHTPLNKFGSWFIIIVFRILNSVGTIGKFLHFIFTTEGRKNNDW